MRHSTEREIANRQKGVVFDTGSQVFGTFWVSESVSQRLATVFVLVPQGNPVDFARMPTFRNKTKKQHNACSNIAQQIESANRTELKGLKWTRQRLMVIRGKTW